VLLILGENDWEQAKFHNFKEQLLWAGFEDILQKTEVISVTKEEQKLQQGFTEKALYNEKYSELVAALVEE